MIKCKCGWEGPKYNMRVVRPQQASGYFHYCPSCGRYIGRFAQEFEPISHDDQQKEHK